MRFLVIIVLLLVSVDVRAQSLLRLEPPTAGVPGVTCGSAVSSCVLKTSRGLLFGGYAVCKSDCWVLVFNSATVPKNGPTTAGTAPGNLVDCFPVKAGTGTSLTYEVYPTTSYSSGITVAISSTYCDVLTLSPVGFVRGVVM